MVNKLKLDIKLLNGKKKLLGCNTFATVYLVRIKVLFKDERFDISEFKDKRVVFSSSNTNFFIGVDPGKPDGELDHFGMFLPIKSKHDKNNELSIIFYTEENRKSYLKKLHIALMEWNLKWEGFYYDTGNGFKFKDNNFVYYCNYLSYDI